MCGWLSADLLSNGIHLHYYRTGGDKPPLVLAHGYSESALIWVEVARALEDEYDVVFFDQRGHGLSDCPLSGYRYADRAADLAGLIEALALERPRVVGHSMGAQGVATFAARYPDSLCCAVLEDPPWFDGSQEDSHAPRSMLREAEAERANIAQRAALSLEPIMAALRSIFPRWSEEIVRNSALAKQQMSPNNVDTLNSAAAWAWRGVAAAIRCPVLLMIANPAKGGLVTAELAEEALAFWPQGSRIVCMDTTHGVHQDDPEGYVAAVQDFLRGC